MIKKGRLVRENHKTKELARKRQMTNEKVKKNSTPPNFLSASSPPLIEFIFSTNFSQPPG
jgi:hypothetical protein